MSSEKPLKAEIFDPIKHCSFIPSIFKILVDLERLAGSTKPESAARLLISRAIDPSSPTNLYLVPSGLLVAALGATEARLNVHDELELVITHGYADPLFKREGLVDKLLTLGQNQAQMMGIKKLVMEALPSHTPRSWKRKYGFTLVHYRMEKEV